MVQLQISEAAIAEAASKARCAAQGLSQSVEMPSTHKAAVHAQPARMSMACACSSAAFCQKLADWDANVSCRAGASCECCSTCMTASLQRLIEWQRQLRKLRVSCRQPSWQPAQPAWLQSPARWAAVGCSRLGEPKPPAQQGCMTCSSRTPPRTRLAVQLKCRRGQRAGFSDRLQI